MNVALLPLAVLLAGDPEPIMVKKGKLLFEEPFSEESFKKNWQGNKGRWTVEDGRVKAAEIPADKHHQARGHKLVHRDVVLQVAFRLEGAKWLGIGFDHAEHVCRAIVTSTSFRVQKTTGIGPTTKSVKLDEAKLQIDPARWYTLLIELRGNEMLASIDGKEIVYGEADGGLDVEKTRFALIGGGETTWFGPLKVWEALPDPAWAKKKPALVASLKRSGR